MGGINFDLIIFLVYATVLAIVAVRSIRDLENQVTVTLDTGKLNSQLAQFALDERLTLKFPLKPYYGFEPLSTLTLKLTNTTDAQLLYVDWDQCTITDPTQRSRRAIRLVPGLSLDASQPQMYTIVPPGKQVQEQLTTETSLGRKPENSPNPLQAQAPVIDLAIAEKLSGGGRTEFSLWLTVGFSPLERRTAPLQDLCTLHCRFIIQRALWIQRVPLAQFIQNLIPDSLELENLGESNRTGWVIFFTGGALLLIVLLLLQS